MADMYYAQNPTCGSNEQTIEYEVNGKVVKLITDRGVFSGSKVDFGTDLLINTLLRAGNAQQGAPNRVLDLGCGYGVVACSLGQIWPSATYCLVDVNERAMDLSRRNLQKNKVTGEVISREKFDAREANAKAEQVSFDIVATNPPIRAGKETVQGFFMLAHNCLQEGGRLYIVIQKKQGADSAFKFLANLFGNAETIARSAGYHIIRCVK